MKRTDLIRHLETHGCQFVREGRQHSLYINRQTRKSAAVPRHREIPQGTVEAFAEL
jgi:mRNA interferase HicA